MLHSDGGMCVVSVLEGELHTMEGIQTLTHKAHTGATHITQSKHIHIHTH